MAKLSSGNLSLEIEYTGWKCGWLNYEITFCWGGKHLLNSRCLKRKTRRTGASWVNNEPNEIEQDDLVRVLKRVLETNKPDYWEPIEPEIVVAFYPEMYFPFIDSHWELMYESDSMKVRREEREEQKEEFGGKLPDDDITVVVNVDTYNFVGEGGYSGQGIALIMVVSRETLEVFCTDLEREYVVLEKPKMVEDTEE